MTTRKRRGKTKMMKKSTARAAKKSTAKRAKATPRAQNEVVTMSREAYEQLLARLEDLEDTREIQAAETRGLTPDALPDPLVQRLLAGEHPLRIWREHRGLTLSQLGQQADVGVSYISEIETSKKPGSAHTLKALAGALKVDLEDLVP